MVDENSTSSPDISDPNLSPNTVEASEPVTKVDSKDTVPIAVTTPTDLKHQELHAAPHSHHKWHAEVRVDGHDVYQGVVKDISTKGFNLIIDHNLQNSKFVKLHIHIPPLNIGSPQHILEVSGKITNTVYDSVESSFRSGVSFLEFTLESDRTYLGSLLS
jgi:hypothetical protein